MIKNLTKQELQNLYYSKTNKEICEHLGISVPTLIKYIRTFEIKQKPLGNRSNKDKYKFNLIKD